MSNVKLIDLYNFLGKIVCRYPYYEVRVSEGLIENLFTYEMSEKVQVDTHNRIILFKKKY